MLKKTLTLALILAPTLTTGAALAEGCHEQRIKLSCAEGTAWDDAKGICASKPSA